MAVKIEDIADLVAGTLENMDPPKFVQAAQDLHNYEMMNRWLKEDRLDVDEGAGGTHVSRPVMTSYPDVAKMVGLFEPDDLVIQDSMKKVTVPWVHATTHWAFEVREVMVNKGKALIFNVIKPRETGAVISMAAKLETKGWTSPSASETKDPYGLPYWVVKNSSQGFNGGNPSGYSTCGGIDASTDENWRNWTDTYSDITAADLIRKLRLAHYKCRWISPITKNDFYNFQGQRFRVYAPYSVIQQLEELAEGRNDNLGADLGPMGDKRAAGLSNVEGTITFLKHPIIPVDYLENDSDDPVYLIDRDVFKVAVLKEDYMRRTGPQQYANHHNTLAVYIDLTFAILCLDRRRNAVIYKI